jgi:hypothetical protein
MKKAILIEPELLAKSKIISPDLYEYYCNSPLSRIEFADYGPPNVQMLMPKRILNLYETLSKGISDEPPQLMHCLQYGWLCGYADLFSKHEGKMTDANRYMTKDFFLKCALHYPSYDFESLIDPNNYVMRDHLMYNKLTYREAQCLEAWRFIFKCPVSFNDFFVEFNTQNNSQDNGEFLNFSPSCN